MDGNEAVGHVAYRINEVMAIYPITPSSPMAEWCGRMGVGREPKHLGHDPVGRRNAERRRRGRRGSRHAANRFAGTTFTASQGLLLMIPNMFKIAGELLPTVFHVTARTVATHALSIFGDHSDIMAAARPAGRCWAPPPCRKRMDFALIAQAATLRARVPFVHFFDGFRTSHEVSKIEMLTDDDLRALIDDELIAEHRARAMTPDQPVLRGTAQNPDVFFQAREACNPFYAACPDIVQKAMDEFAARTRPRLQSV